jgi:hypothetical protein
MNKRAGTILILAACVILPMFLGAQERMERAQPVMSEEFWGSLIVHGRAPKFLNDVIGKDVRKRFRLKGEMGYRSADTFFAGRQVYFDGSIRYTFSDLLKVGVEQRYAMRPGRENRTRTALKIYLGQSFGRLDLGYRFVYQHNYRELGRVRELFRNRFSAEYNIRKWKLDPVIQTEFFTWANPYGLTYIGTRYKLGTSWSPWKGHSITFFFVHDRERDVAWPDHRVIYSLDYAINLRRL